MEENNRVRAILLPADCELFENILHSYDHRRLGARAHLLTSVKRDNSIITNLVCSSGLPPWKWTEKVLFNWAYSLFEKNLTVSTQSTYQTAIKKFLQYMCESHRSACAISKLTGRRPTNESKCMAPIRHESRLVEK